MARHCIDPVEDAIFLYQSYLALCSKLIVYASIFYLVMRITVNLSSFGLRVILADHNVSISLYASAESNQGIVESLIQSLIVFLVHPNLNGLSFLGMPALTMGAWEKRNLLLYSLLFVVDIMRCCEDQVR